jgi:hypothetical protein
MVHQVSGPHLNGRHDQRLVLTGPDGIDGARFRAQLERGKVDGTVKIKGLPFVGQQEMLDLLAAVTAQNMKDVSIDGLVAQRPVEVRVKQGRSKTEERRPSAASPREVRPGPSPGLSAQRGD